MCANSFSTPSPEGFLPAGKLSPALLDALLATLPISDPQLVLGPSVGEDAAVIDFAGGDRLLVAKSDPITFATDEIGFYAVNVCANDLAVTGARPRFYLPTILLPAGETAETLVDVLFEQIGAACRRLSIVVAGGHTEITQAVNQPIVAGTMLGEVQRGRLVRSGGAHPGHVVLLAGSVPVEGASIIAREKRTELLDRGWSHGELDTAAAYLRDPGISVLVPALAAADAGLVSAMHDPTEGGVASGLCELAVASGAGLSVDLDRIRVSSLGGKLCAVYGLDPLGVIASGALLATCAPDRVDPLQALWRTLGWSGTVIGEITSVPGQLIARRNGQPCAFPTFAVDEITKLFA